MPNQKLSTSKLAGRIVFFMLIVMIITHLIIFVVYSNMNQDKALKVNRDLMAQQVLHLIQMVLTTPKSDREKVIDSVDVPNISITITKKPEEKLAFTQASLWDVLEKISKQRDVIRLSLFLEEDQWLNVSGIIAVKSWTLQFFFLSLEVILAFSVLFYYWSINRFTEPVRNFASAAERLGRDLHSPPLVEAGPPVVREAVRAMNQMQDRIRDMVHDRTLMLAAISHDLRTPITRLKLRSQLIDEAEISTKNVQDLDEMSDMISEILVLAKEHDESKQKSKIDLASLLSSLCDDLLETYGNVSYEGPQARVNVFGRSLALKRALTNLITNAIKYSGKAYVKLSIIKNKSIVVTVEDDGPGIPEEDLDRVFAPFYRSEKSRSRGTGGAGLGLAITQEIIHAHEGQITLENKPEGGLRVTVKLPLEKN